MRVLVISNTCFSSTESNGKTLAKYFLNCFEKGELAQFFVHGSPDYTVCDRYYKVTDGDALKSFLKQKEFGDCVTDVEAASTGQVNQAVKSKTPFKFLAREIVWKYGKWNGKRLEKWISDFAPTHIFLFLAGNAFLIDFARRLSKKLNIPIIAYTTEDYYFKRYNYITKKFSLTYQLLSGKVRKAYKKCENYIQLCILNSPMLCETFEKEFSFPCKYLFAKSDIDHIPNFKVPDEGYIVSYLGNLGLNRHKALMEIADELNKLKPGTKLQVYGNLPETAKEELLSNSNISYNGVVSFDRVVEVIHNSNLIIHAEYDDAYNQIDLKYAFSTKIADSVCSGTPFLMYANSQLAGTDFLIRNECAFVAEDRKKLPEVLYHAVSDEKERSKIVENAAAVRDRYFRVGYGAQLRDLMMECENHISQADID